MFSNIQQYVLTLHNPGCEYTLERSKIQNNIMCRSLESNMTTRLAHTESAPYLHGQPTFSVLSQL
jgi:hypothetical protein